MVKQQEYSFSTLLTRHLIAMFLLLMTILLVWIYLSTNRSLVAQQNLNIDLNNRNSALVLDSLQQKLLSTLQDSTILLTALSAEEFQGGRPALSHILQNESISHLDLLRFITTDSNSEFNADSPFFDFSGVDMLLSQDIDRFLNRCHLLPIDSSTPPLWVLISGQRVVQQNSGKVLGHLIGGVVINNNLPLTREILLRSNAAYVVLSAGDRLISTSKPLHSTLLDLVEQCHDDITRSSVKYADQEERLIISRYPYFFFNELPLSVLLIYHDTLFTDMQRIFISSGFLLLLATVILFLLVYRFSNQQANLAMQNLLNFTVNIPNQPEQIQYPPGKLAEFNRIGEAVEKTVAMLNVATAELKETKERLELVVNGADLGTWDWDIQRGTVVFNERWATMLGYNLDEIEPVAASWRDRIHPDDLDRVNHTLASHLEGKTTFYQTEHRLKHKSGRWVWVLAAGKVFNTDPQGNPIRAVGIHMDITRPKEAENSLARERALLVSMINSIPDLIFYKDSESKFLGCNKAFEQLIGHKEAQIAGRTDHDFFPKDLAEFFREQDRSMLASGKPQRNEEWVTYPDGHSELLDTLKTPFIGPDNKILGLIGISRDITKIKETEQTLADERERLSVTLRSIGDGVITTDTAGNIVLLNKVAEELTGWMSEEAQGMPSEQIFHIIDEKSGEQSTSPVQQVLKDGRIITLANHTILISRDGIQRNIADSGAPIRDRQSNIVGVVIVFRDVTTEQRMEEELLKAKKLESIGVLAGGIAHDFNNILSAILGNLELASALTDPGNNKIHSLLANAQKATNRAAKLTQQLLTFAKGGDPVKETTSLPKLIQESADFVLHGSRISCEYSFPENLWKVDADVEQIGQVIQNIILNGKHAMPSGGEIRVSARNIDDTSQEAFFSSGHRHYVVISIEDSGIGISPDVIDKIFDPYFTTKQEGSGLGLAICHSIIKKHDGHLTVQSKPGKGTIFNIYIPKAEKTQSMLIHDQSPLPPITSARVLVMDDEEMLRILAAEQLKLLGHSAILVENGEQALQAYRENREQGTPVDAVILDLTIRGGMGGQETSQRLLEYDPHARIIVASGYSNDPVMSHYRDYGLYAAVVKPFDLSSLSRALEKAMQ